ncbi:spermidine synthase [Sphingomonas sp. UYP23]
MSPIHLVDTAQIPGGGLLSLMRCGSDFSIWFGEDELMGNTEVGSERALATLALARMNRPADRVLIGGLGMGFTLGAALTTFPAGAKIVVSELVPQVVAWAKGPLQHLFFDYLTDPRVTLEVRDVHDVIVDEVAAFDAILLDVDNGPDGFIHLANDRLYCDWGLRDAYAALRPGGVLGIWSAYQDDAFVERLEKAGFGVEEVTVQATDPTARSPFTIWLASRPMQASGNASRPPVQLQLEE